MNNEKVTKINKLGKALRIIINICRCLLIVGIVCCIIGAVLCLNIPNDAVSVNGTAKGIVTIDDSKVPSFIELVDIEESDIHLNSHGLDIVWNVTENKSTDDIRTIDINGNAENVTGKEIKLAAAGACGTGALVCAIYLIMLTFGGKLANALETCNSPFEENVIRRMKHFAYSLIPWVIVDAGGIHINVMTVMFVIIFIILTHVFAYGAELQRESDETV